MRASSLAAISMLAGCQLVFRLEDRDASQADAPIPGLVAHYPLDELAGNVTSEIVNSREAVCAAGTCPTVIEDGRRGKAFHLDGTQLMRIQSGAAFDLPVFTIAVWIRLSQPVVDFHAIVALPTAAAADPWALYVQDDKATFETAHVDNDPYLIGGPAFVPGDWHHVVGLWDGSVKRLAFDGLIVNFTNPLPMHIDGPTIAAAIGADINNGVADSFFIGDIDDIQLYDRVLDDIELIGLTQ